MDCSNNYEDNNCPKGKPIRFELEQQNINFLTVGCWASYCRDGQQDAKEYDYDDNKWIHTKPEYGQKRVVDGMVKYTNMVKTEALILAGDNIYDANLPKKKLEDMIELLKTDEKSLPKDLRKCMETNKLKSCVKRDHTLSQSDIDIQLSEGFEKCLDQVKVNNFFIGVGNHDIINCYTLNRQLNYNTEHKDTKLQYRLEAMYYNVVYTLKYNDKKYKINLIIIDTNMFTEGEQCNNKPYTSEHIKTQTEWIEQVLEEEKADFNIVIGHSPVKANGHKKKKGEKISKYIYNEELDKMLTTICKKYKIQAYICADEHNQQFLYDDELKLSLVVAGCGGTELDKNIFVDHYEDISKYEKSAFGFVSLSFEPSLLCIRYHICDKDEYYTNKVIYIDRNGDIVNNSITV